MIGGLLAGMALLILIALLLLFEFRVLGIIDYTKKKFKWENNKVVWIIVISFFGFPKINSFPHNHLVKYCS